MYIILQASNTNHRCHLLANEIFLSFTEQLLQDKDKLSVLFTPENAQLVQFILKYKPTPPPATAVLRVHHQIDQDFETFQSLIVSPSMTTNDVIQLSLARITLDGSRDSSHDQFELVLRTAEGGNYVLNSHVIIIKTMI